MGGVFLEGKGRYPQQRTQTLVAHPKEEGSWAQELGKRKKGVQDETVEGSTQNLVDTIKV